MTDNVTLPGTGSVVETIDEGSGVERQVFALGSIGKSGSETQLTAGQKTSANSIPVVLPSDPDSRPSSGTITAVDSGTTATAGQDSIALITGTPSASSFQAFAINGQATARIQITGTWVGALQIEGSIDGGTTYVPMPARVCGTVFTRPSVTANGLFDLLVSGLTHVRVRATSWTSGTATVRSTFSGLANYAPPSGLAVLGTRPFLIKGTINNGQTSYTNFLCVGGLITVAAGLPPGTIINTMTVRVKLRVADAAALPTMGILLFDANPASSTYTDNTTQSLAVADVAKCILDQNVAAAISTGITGGMTNYALNIGRMPVDSSGNIYFAFVVNSSGGTFSVTAANVLTYELDGLY